MLSEERNNDIHHEDVQMNGEIGCGKYRYKVFGLQIASDIVLPELLTMMDSVATPDVNIRVGNVSCSANLSGEKQSYQVEKNKFLFQVRGVGCYYVTNGNCIIVEPAKQAEERYLRIFLLGTAFGALLMQRGLLPIHGSAVLIDGGCVIFTGISGAGKSTLLAAFRKRGYSFLTDDVAAVSIDEKGVAWVHSAYPQQKLWQDSAENIGVDIASLTPFYTGVDREKFVVPTNNGFCQSSVPLIAVYELEAATCQDVTLTALQGIDKLSLLMSHTYRPWLLDGLGLKEIHFKHCVAIANQVAIACLARPVGVFSTEEQVRVVEEDLARLFADRAISGF